MIAALLALLLTLVSVAPAASLPPGMESPVPVTAAVSVSSVAGVDEAAGSFSATVDVTLRWRDPAVAFDRFQAGTDHRVYVGEQADARRAEIWDPGVAVANLVDEPEGPEARKLREVSLRIYADGAVEYIQRLRGTFATDIDLSRFPFDTQDLAVRIASPVYNTRQVRLLHGQREAELSTVSPRAALSEWTIARRVRFHADELRGLDGMIHSDLSARVQITRVTRSYVASLFAPLAVILLLPVLCIWVRTDIHERINWVITAVFSLIALNFSTSIEYPALSVDSTFMRLFWYGYVAQGAALGLIMALFNEDRLSAWLGADVIAEAIDYLSWALPLIIALAFGDVLLSLAI